VAMDVQVGVHPKPWIGLLMVVDMSTIDLLQDMWWWYPSDCLDMCSSAQL
jgi:hypothetical protein